MKSSTKILVILSLTAVFTLVGTSVLIGSSQNIYSCDGANVCSVTLASQPKMYAGNTASANRNATSRFVFTINNPGSSTYFNSLILTGSNLTNPIQEWSTTPSTNNLEIFYIQYPYGPTYSTYSSSESILTPTKDAGNSLAAGTATSFTFYPVTNGTSEALNAGQTYNFVMNFAIGQSISGSVIAQ